jgi:Tfp pilus assembly protein PilF
MNFSALIPLCVSVMLGSVLVLAYATGLMGAFFFDDGASILLAPGVQLQAFTLDGLRQAWNSGGAGPTGRPVAQLSFALNHWASGGFHPLAFKATNLAIHLLCGGVVWGVLRHMLASAYPQLPGSQRRTIAIVVTAIWLSHPIQLLPVLHVVQRMTSLSGLFLLSAFWLHLRARDRTATAAWWQFLLAWVVLWPLSILSKETGILLPAFVLAWELTVNRARTERLDLFARGLCIVMGIAALASFIYIFTGRAQWMWSGYAMRSFTMFERLITEGRVLWLYLEWILLPNLSNFALYHDDIQLSVDVLTPWTTLPAGMGVAAMLALAWYLRQRAPWVSLGIAWFFVGHSLESTVLPLEIAHEHRNYLPLLGPLFAALGLALGSPQQPRIWPRPAVAMPLGLTLLLTAMTGLRAYEFGDEVRRTQTAVLQHPASARSHYEAGQTLDNMMPQGASPEMPLFQRARSHYQQALALDPQAKMASLALVYLACKAGQQPSSVDVDLLAQRLRSTPFAPGDRTVLYGLKEMAIQQPLCLGRPEVMRLFDAALTNPVVDNGVRAMLWSWSADYLWLVAKDLSAAQAALARSLALYPASPSNQLKWAQLQFIAGDFSAARASLLALRGALLTAEERQTLNEVLATINMSTH